MTPTPTDLSGLDGHNSDNDADDSKKTTAKRRKLRHYDLLPAQLLNPMGESGIGNVDLARLWSLMNSGNKAAEFFSELCDEDAARHRVAISRLADVLRAAIENIYSEAATKVIQSKLLGEAKKELDVIKPALEHLIIKDYVGSESKSIRTIAYKKTAAAKRTKEDIEEAAKKLFQWLNKSRSASRSLIAFLSSGGLHYVTQVHEKGCRAYINKGVTEEEFIKTCSQGGDLEGAGPCVDEMSGLSF